MNERFAKWNRWLDIIYDQVTDLAVYRHIFWEVQNIIKNNQRIQKPSSFYTFLGTSYVALAVMGVRRQIKQDRQSISFARLLQEIDIIGDSIYLLYANLYDLTRQTARVSGRDRTEAR